MKLAVFSDTHGVTAPMLEMISQYRPDVVFHLGDCERDMQDVLKAFPDVPVHMVCGNCDYAPSSPSAITVACGPVRVFMTHGHLYHIDYGSVDSLVYAAQEAGAQLVLFGHTHIPMNRDVGGIRVVNPGTAGKGRNRTCAVIEIFDNGGIASEIRSLEKP